MQGYELLQNQLDEMVFVRRCHRGWHPGRHCDFSRSLVVLNNGSNNFTQGLAIAQTKNIWRYQALFDCHVLLTGALVSPDKNVTQKFDAIEFVHTNHGVHVSLLRHVDERQGTKVVANERYVCSQSRHPLVHILKWLQVGQMHHQKKSLLEGVEDFCRHLDDDAKQLFKPLRQGNGQIHTAPYLDRPAPDAPRPPGGGNPSPFATRG